MIDGILIIKYTSHLLKAEINLRKNSYLVLNNLNNKASKEKYGITIKRTKAR